MPSSSACVPACLQDCVRAVAEAKCSPDIVDAVMGSLRQEMTQQTEGCGTTGALHNSIAKVPISWCWALRSRSGPCSPWCLLPLQVTWLRTLFCLPGAEDMLEPGQRKLRQKLYKIKHSLRHGGIGPAEGERGGAGGGALRSSSTQYMR